VSQTSVVPRSSISRASMLEACRRRGACKNSSWVLGGRAGAADGRARAVFSDTARWIGVVNGRFKLIAPSRRIRFRSRKERLQQVFRRAKLAWKGMGRGGVELYDLGLDPASETRREPREGHRQGARGGGLSILQNRSAGMVRGGGPHAGRRRANAEGTGRAGVSLMAAAGSQPFH